MNFIYNINGSQTWQDAGLSIQGSPTAWTQENITLSALDGHYNIRIGFEMMEAQLADRVPNPYHSIDELKIIDTPTPIGEINGKVIFETNKPASSVNSDTLSYGVYLVQPIGSTNHVLRAVKIKPLKTSLNARSRVRVNYDTFF